MNKYELTVMIHPDLEMDTAVATDKVMKLITDNGGEIVKEANEGKKRLAYPVSKQEFAVYHYYELNLPAEAPGKISNVLNITDEIIRYLLVREDPLKAKYLARRKARHLDEEGEEGEDAEDSAAGAADTENAEDAAVDAENAEEEVNEKEEE